MCIPTNWLIKKKRENGLALEERELINLAQWKHFPVRLFISCGPLLQDRCSFCQWSDTSTNTIQQTSGGFLCSLIIPFRFTIRGRKQSCDSKFVATFAAPCTQSVHFEDSLSCGTSGWSLAGRSGKDKNPRGTRVRAHIPHDFPASWKRFHLASPITTILPNERIQNAAIVIITAFTPNLQLRSGVIIPRHANMCQVSLHS